MIFIISLQWPAENTFPLKYQTIYTFSEDERPTPGCLSGSDSTQSLCVFPKMKCEGLDACGRGPFLANGTQ